MGVARSTATADITLDGQDCVLVVIHAGAQQSLENARENLAGTIEVSGGTKRPLLVDVSRCPPLTPEVRHFYTGERLVEAFVALALVTEASPFGRTMGNIYLRVARPGIPMRLFEDRPGAFGWLRTFVH